MEKKISQSILSTRVDEEAIALAREFRRLEQVQRRRGLSLGEAGRYHRLFHRLSDATTGAERQSRRQIRRFLRVAHPIELRMLSLTDDIIVSCPHFGTGGCAVRTSEQLVADQEIVFGGALVAGAEYPLRVRAQVVWSRPPGDAEPGEYGLSFIVDSPHLQAQIDEIFYRTLDLYLGAGPIRAVP